LTDNLIARSIALALAAFLLGSIPSGYLVGKARGVDVRRWGSGRTGGTNVWRALGMVPAVVTIVADALKTVAAVMLARAFVGTGWSQVLAGSMAILGHNYTPFLGFRGGRGVVAAIAAMAALCFPATAVVLVAGGIVLLVLRYVSLASLTVAALMPASLLLYRLAFGGDIWWPVYGLVAAALIWVSHLDNVRRLLRGTERRLGDPVRPPS